MPEETPTGPPPSVDSVKAAQNVPAAPAPAP